MAGAGVRKQALAEIAREKGRMQDQAASQPVSFSLSVEDAIDFEDQERIKAELKKEPGQKIEREAPFEPVQEIGEEVQSRDDGLAFNWAPYGGGGGIKKKKREAPKSLNTATIWCMGRKMMAREWAKALGITKPDPRVVALEREALAYGERQEDEKRKKEEERLRAIEAKAKIEEPLRIFGDRLLAKKEEEGHLTSKMVNDLLEEVLGDIGMIYEMNWLKDGCEIWLEPWDERYIRQKMHESEPVIYRLVIDDNLDILSYDLVRDEELKREKRKELFGKNLQEIEAKAASPEEGLVFEDEETIKGFLETELSKTGRIEEVRKWGHLSWTALVEPWDEMKKRNMERKGEPPIVTERILARAVKGKLVVVPLKDAGKPWEGGYGVQEYALSDISR